MEADREENSCKDWSLGNSKMLQKDEEKTEKDTQMKVPVN